VNIKKQQGMSTLGILMAVVLVVSAMLLAMKLVPLYINDYAIAKAVTSLQEVEGLYGKTKSEIRSTLRRKLTADYTDDLTNESIQIEKRKGIMTIDVVYEARVSVVYNLDIVASFAHHLEKKK